MKQRGKCFACLDRRFEVSLEVRRPVNVDPCAMRQSSAMTVLAGTGEVIGKVRQRSKVRKYAMGGPTLRADPLALQLQDEVAPCQTHLVVVSVHSASFSAC